MRADYDERLKDIMIDCGKSKYPCPNKVNPVWNSFEEHNDAANSAEIVEGISNTSFIIGGLSIIGSVVLFTLSGDSGAADKDTALPRLQAVGPTLLRDGSTGLGATWSF